MEIGGGKSSLGEIVDIVVLDDSVVALNEGRLVWFSPQGTITREIPLPIAPRTTPRTFTVSVDGFVLGGDSRVSLGTTLPWMMGLSRDGIAQWEELLGCNGRVVDVASSTFGRSLAGATLGCKGEEVQLDLWARGGDGVLLGGFLEREPPLLWNVTAARDGGFWAVGGRRSPISSGPYTTIIKTDEELEVEWERERPTGVSYADARGLVELPDGSLVFGINELTRRREPIRTARLHARAPDGDELFERVIDGAREVDDLAWSSDSSGSLIALVELPRGSQEIVRYSDDGTELGRLPLFDRCTSKFDGLRTTEDGFVVFGRTCLVSFDTSGSIRWRWPTGPQGPHQVTTVLGDGDDVLVAGDAGAHGFVARFEGPSLEHAHVLIDAADPARTTRATDGLRTEEGWLVVGATGLAGGFVAWLDDADRLLRSSSVGAAIEAIEPIEPIESTSAGAAYIAGGSFRTNPWVAWLRDDGTVVRELVLTTCEAFPCPDERADELADWGVVSLAPRPGRVSVGLQHRDAPDAIRVVHLTEAGIVQVEHILSAAVDPLPLSLDAGRLALAGLPDGSLVLAAATGDLGRPCEGPECASIVVAKLDAADTLQWARLYATQGQQAISQLIGVDEDGLMMAGWTTGIAFPQASGWLFKLDEAGQVDAQCDVERSVGPLQVLRGSDAGLPQIVATPVSTRARDIMQLQPVGLDVATPTVSASRSCLGNAGNYVQVTVAARNGTIVSDPAGLDCPVNCSFPFAPGGLRLVAIPDPGHVFQGWLGDCAAFEDTRDIVLDLTDPLQCEARFTRGCSPDDCGSGTCGSDGRCVCDEGFAGDWCEICEVGFVGESSSSGGIECRDIDECADEPCEHGGTCVNEPGSFLCDCFGLDYEGDYCEIPLDCIPACEDRICGDDGCGGTCGECVGLGQRCSEAGQCVCPPDGCPPLDCEAFMGEDLGTSVGRALLSYESSPDDRDDWGSPSCAGRFIRGDRTFTWAAPTDGCFVFDLSASTNPAVLRLYPSCFADSESGQLACADSEGDRQVRVELDAGEPQVLVIDSDPAVEAGSNQVQLSIDAVACDPPEPECDVCSAGLEGGSVNADFCCVSQRRYQQMRACACSTHSEDVGCSACQGNLCGTVAPSDACLECLTTTCADQLAACEDDPSLSYCEPEQCDDDIDNDGDELTDCQDRDCRLSPACETTCVTCEESWSVGDEIPLCCGSQLPDQELRSCGCSATCELECGSNYCAGEPMSEVCEACVQFNCIAATSDCRRDSSSELCGDTEICDNGIDDTGEGDIDCGDLGCLESPQCPCPVDSFEPNDDPGTATTLLGGDGERATLCPRDEDWYQLADVGECIRAQVSGDPFPVGQIDLEVYQGGEVIASGVGPDSSELLFAQLQGRAGVPSRVFGGPSTGRLHRVRTAG